MRRRAFFRDRSGAAAIEFAIVGNVFLMLLFGIAYIGIIYWHAANLDWAVDAGSRIAILNSSATQGDISTAVNGYLTQVGMG
ncbi:MAG TPA: TadE/TadG family type IV pilus assembly protein, partial [Rhizomicrobium sp.]